MSMTPVDWAKYAVAVESSTVSRYVAALATAVAVYVPQLALLALLLTSKTRVGSFVPLALVLAVSDGLTLYFGAAAVVQLWYIGWVEDSLMKSAPPGASFTIAGTPGFIRWLMDARKSTKIDTSWRMGLLLGVLCIFVVGVNVYIGWLWFNP